MNLSNNFAIRHVQHTIIPISLNKSAEYAIIHAIPVRNLIEQINVTHAQRRIIEHWMVAAVFANLDISKNIQGSVVSLVQIVTWSA
jgi:hypothetical protein